MTFLSTGLLAGLIAVGIPVGLHLLARQQPKRVVFPATRFLKQSLDSHRDRLKVRRWWLLAMRIMAIAMLAIAFARPQIDTITSEAWFIIGAIALVGLALLALATVAVIRNLAKPLRFTLAIAGLLALVGSGVFGAVTMARAPKSTVTDSSPTALAIVIDNSIRSSRRLPVIAPQSSAATEPNDESSDVISKMRAAAKWMVGEHTTDSLIAIIDRSARPATFSIDRAAATSRIDRTEPLTQVLPLPDRIQAAVALVRSSYLQKRSVLVITDLTSPSFSPEHWDSARLQSLLSQSPPVILQILDVGSEAELNHSLAQLTVNDPTPPRLAKSNISVVVSSPKRKSGQPPKTLQVQLDMYDTTSEASLGLPIVRDSKTVFPPLRSVDRTSVQADGTSALAVLSVPPLEAGTHHGIVKLITDDELAADNERFVTWVVREPKRILIVGSDRDEMNVLAGALNSPLSVDDPLAEYAIEMSEFLPSDVESWKRFAALVLVDPQSPSPPIQAELTRYLQTGGHVLSLLGPSLSAASDATDSLPAGIVRPWRIPQPGTFIEVIRPHHRAVASLREIAGGVPWHAF
ncbi:MAG: BatA domain-containing protein, partial [Planctomycetaceae bacterium]